MLIVIHLRLEDLSCDHELTLRITKQVQLVLYFTPHTPYSIPHTLYPIPHTPYPIES